MRVVSGKYRGKKLSAPILTDQIKPTSDRVKEAIFNILSHAIKESVFIDMFAGSGQMGIEALSRGVKKVYFIDNNPQSVSCIKQNLQGVEGDYEILEMNFDNALKALKDKGVKADVVYSDPPYNLDLGEKILNTIHKNSILNYGSIIAIERNKIFSSPKSRLFYLYDTRKYAGSMIDFYKRQKRVAITGTFDPFTNGHMDLVLKAKETFDRIYIVILINKDKVIRYPLEKRKKMIFASIKDIEENIVVENYDGLAIDYCNKNDIQYILRGVRNSKDFEYEKQMADYNFKNGNVTTILMPAKSADISSSLVRESLDSRKDVSQMLNKNVIEILKE